MTKSHPSHFPYCRHLAPKRMAVLTIDMRIDCNVLAGLQRCAVAA